MTGDCIVSTIPRHQSLERLSENNASVSSLLTVTPAELQQGLITAGFESPDTSDWVGMRPTLRWPHQGLYRLVFLGKGFGGLMDQWKMCGSDRSASYLGWARKPLAG